MLRQMTPKERILAAIDHKSVDKIPTDYWGTPEATNKIMKELRVENSMELWKKLDIDKIINVGPQYIGPSLEGDGELRKDYWGVESKPVNYGDNLGTYYEMVYHPLENLNTIREIEDNYIWPKADWFDYKGIAEECEKYPENAIECGYIAPFYMYNNIRGLERSLMDLALDEELACYIIDKICIFLYEYHERLFEAGKGRIDIAQVTDDFGTQNGLMISVDMFDKYFKRHYQRFIKLLKDHGIRVFHHNDGSIMEILPRMVELGIDILNPIQWHLPGMDLKELKQRFGKKICFHGGIDNQYVLPFGTPEEVRQEVITCIDTLACDGTGFILAPCHNVQANTPVENIIMMYRTAKEYGQQIIK